MFTAIATASGLKRFYSYSLLAMAYLYIFLVLFRYDVAWRFVEEPWIENKILANGRHLQLGDLLRVFDTQIFENVPRTTRPLSSFMQLVDTKLRVALWKYMVPHPSLSLTHLFSLFLAPWLLFKFFKGRGLDPSIARLAVALYLISPGVLSTIAVPFRPAKAMTNFSLILFMFWGSYLQRCKPNQDRAFHWYLLTMFVSLFWDETALLIYPLTVILFPSLLSSRRRVLAYLTIIPAVLFSYFCLIPALAKIGGQAFARLGNYDLYGRSFLFLKSDLWLNIFPNFRILLLETIGIAPISLITSPAGKLLIFTNILGALFLATKALLGWYQGKISRPESIELGRAFLLLLLFTVSHSFLMNVNAAHIWGPYWYGVYWSIALVLVLVALTRMVGFWSFALPISLMIAGVMYIFPFTSNAYKHFHYYPCYPGGVVEMFENRFNRFTLVSDTPSNLYALTKTYWEHKRKDKSVSSLQMPRELFYLPVEMGAVGVTEFLGKIDYYKTGVYEFFP